MEEMRYPKCEAEKYAYHSSPTVPVVSNELHTIPKFIILPRLDWPKFISNIHHPITRRPCNYTKQLLQCMLPILISIVVLVRSIKEYISPLSVDTCQRNISPTIP